MEIDCQSCIRFEKNYPFEDAIHVGFQLIPDRYRVSSLLMIALASHTHPVTKVVIKYKIGACAFTWEKTI